MEIGKQSEPAMNGQATVFKDAEGESKDPKAAGEGEEQGMSNEDFVRTLRAHGVSMDMTGEEGVAGGNDDTQEVPTTPVKDPATVEQSLAGAASLQDVISPASSMSLHQVDASVSRTPPRSPVPTRPNRAIESVASEAESRILSVLDRMRVEKTGEDRRVPSNSNWNGLLGRVVASGAIGSNPGDIPRGSNHQKVPSLEKSTSVRRRQPSFAREASSSASHNSHAQKTSLNRTGKALWGITAQLVQANQLGKKQEQPVSSAGAQTAANTQELQTPELHANSGDLVSQNTTLIFRQQLDPTKEADESDEPQSETFQTPPDTQPPSPSDAVKKTSVDDVLLPLGEQHGIPDGSNSHEMVKDLEAGPVDPITATIASAGVDRRKRFNLRGAVRDEVQKDWETFQDYLRPRKASAYSYCKTVLLYIMLPSLGIAAILYYLADNPPTGTLEDPDLEAKPGKASASWWLIFIGIRQVVTFSMALLVQSFVIDFLSLRLGLAVRFLGSAAALLIISSRGWPFLLFFWALIDLIMLSGETPFSQHWLYWQDKIHLFNENNPAGHVTGDEFYFQILAAAMVVGAAVALKRQYFGFIVARRRFVNYGDQLTEVMRKIVLISEVAGLAKKLKRNYFAKLKNKDRGRKSVDTPFNMPYVSPGFYDSLATDTTADVAPAAPEFTVSQRQKIMDAVGEWEEPIRRAKNEDFSLSCIYQFTQALEILDNDFPLSPAFGPARNRDESLESGERVYNDLLLGCPNSELLKFEVIAGTALDEDDNLDPLKVKELISLFRPDRQGFLTMEEFLASTDEVYRSLRLLQASIDASSRIDNAFEQIFNIGFYGVLFAIVLGMLGFSPMALFLSLSGIIVSFAFIVGQASSKIFEGILFILGRRPYDIGDRIHVSAVNTDTSRDGSPGWIVKDITLFTTTIMFYTQETATVSNGSLAVMRVINMNRSPKAVVFIDLKFGVDVSYELVKAFKEVAEDFVRDRPREWIKLLGFRATKVEADCGYIQYVVILQHRESWANVGVINQSKAELASFCLEVSKQMKMGYKSPPLPVDLQLNNQNLPIHQSTATQGQREMEALMALFQQSSNL